jgi:hypothetical protein
MIRPCAACGANNRVPAKHLVHELAREMAGQGLVLEVNTEECPMLAAQFRVQSIPYVFRAQKCVAGSPWRRRLTFKV